MKVEVLGVGVDQEDATCSTVLSGAGRNVSAKSGREKRALLLRGGEPPVNAHTDSSNQPPTHPHTHTFVESHEEESHLLRRILYDSSEITPDIHRHNPYF